MGGLQKHIVSSHFLMNSVWKLGHPSLWSSSYPPFGGLPRFAISTDTPHPLPTLLPLTPKAVSFGLLGPGPKEGVLRGL